MYVMSVNWKNGLLLFLNFLVLSARMFFLIYSKTLFPLCLDPTSDDEVREPEVDEPQGMSF